MIRRNKLICNNCKLLLCGTTINSPVCWTVLSKENMKYLWAFTVSLVLSVALAKAADNPSSATSDIPELVEPLTKIAKTFVDAARTATLAAVSSDAASKSLFFAAAEPHPLDLLENALIKLIDNISSIIVAK